MTPPFVGLRLRLCVFCVFTLLVHTSLMLYGCFAQGAVTVACRLVATALLRMHAPTHAAHEMQLGRALDVLPFFHSFLALSFCGFYTRQMRRNIPCSV